MDSLEGCMMNVTTSNPEQHDVFVSQSDKSNTVEAISHFYNTSIILLTLFPYTKMATIIRKLS